MLFIGWKTMLQQYDQEAVKMNRGQVLMVIESVYQSSVVVAVALR